jgi:hypothetical protein
VIVCPLCGSKADQLFTGVACEGRDCENYDEKTQPNIKLPTPSNEDLEAWMRAYQTGFFVP